MGFTREVFPETQGLLQRLYQQSRHHQVRQRAHCILLSSQSYSIAQLIDIFGVSRKTLYNWFNSWDAQGFVGLYNRPGRGRKGTFNPEQIEQIRNWTQLSSTTTQTGGGEGTRRMGHFNQRQNN